MNFLEKSVQGGTRMDIISREQRDRTLRNTDENKIKELGPTVDELLKWVMGLFEKPTKSNTHHCVYLTCDLNNKMGIFYDKTDRDWNWLVMYLLANRFEDEYKYKVEYQSDVDGIESLSISIPKTMTDKMIVCIKTSGGLVLSLSQGDDGNIYFTYKGERFLLLEFRQMEVGKTVWLKARKVIKEKLSDEVYEVVESTPISSITISRAKAE